MKTALFALFLLSAFTLHLRSAIADPVFDTNGEPLRNGGSYYILPVFRGRGGGLGLAPVGNETCPLSVVQSRSEASYGLPVRLSSPAKILYINEGLKLDVAFTAVPTCAETPSMWTVVDDYSEGWSLKISGYEDTLDGKFSIKRYERDYKLVFCPRSCVCCGDIGVDNDNYGNRRLVVTDDNAPFRVKFKRARSVSAA